jgi:TolB-like protein
VLVAKLSKLDGVHVISPSTARRYERVGIAPNLMARMLWVGVTLEGVVQEADGRRRITARLTEQAGVIAAAVGARLRPSR